MAPLVFNHWRAVVEPVLIAVYREMVSRLGCSVDAILCDPELRDEFLAGVRAAAGDKPERDILAGVSNLRKQSKLPRSRAATGV